MDWGERRKEMGEGMGKSQPKARPRLPWIHAHYVHTHKEGVSAMSLTP